LIAVLLRNKPIIILKFYSQAVYLGLYHTEFRNRTVIRPFLQNSLIHNRHYNVLFTVGYMGDSVSQSDGWFKEKVRDQPKTDCFYSMFAITVMFYVDSLFH